MKRTVIAILTALALATALAGPAAAKITPTTTDTGCVNNGGHYPAGQQPTCKHEGGLTQESTTVWTNPQGFAPHGWNK